MKPGDLVRVIEDSRFDDSGIIGIVQWVNESYPNECGLLMNGEFEVYAVRHLEVVSESLCKSEAGVV